ncbi:MAG TPA: sporulation protein [Myxococcaceae bacterium]|jgi:sporulation-control protein
MSFFEKMLASVGIGNATVDTRLRNSQVRVGDKLEGVVHIKGGSTDQQIDSIYLQLMTQYLKPQGDNNTVRVTTSVCKWEVSRPIQLGAGQEREVPFSFAVPLNVPITLGKVPVWLKTGLDIDNAVDPGDTDKLEVLPHPHMKAVLDAVTSMGFQLKTSTCEYSSRLGRDLPFVQEIEFHPSGRFGGVKELELVFSVRPDGVEVIVEVDRRARSLGGLLAAALDMDESKERVFFSTSELSSRQHLSEQLASIIQAHSG